MILKLYTQFPRCYPGGIEEMTAQLDDIAAMGFNAVWVNPLHLSGLKKIKRHNKIVSSSLYAMRSCELFNPRFFQGAENDDAAAKAQQDYHRELLIKYTQKARSLGIFPLFDLVLRQVAAEPDSEAVDADQNPLVSQFKQVLVENITSRDDIRKFQYVIEGQADTTIPIQEHVFTQLWEPFIYEYMVNCGFMGVRIDAVKWVPPQLLVKVCSYIQTLCQQHYSGVKAIILAELLDKVPLKYVDTLLGKGITHVNNSVAHTPFTVEARKRDKKEGGWNAGDYTLREITNLRTIGLPSAGGSVGYSGNHDEMSLSLRVLKDNGLTRASVPAEAEFMRLAREKLLGIALSSDAGWYALAGDEFLIDRRPYMVFDNYQPESFLGEDHSLDLRGFIASINQLLSCLPAPDFFWVEYIVPAELNAQDYSIVIRHTQVYNNPHDIMSLVCASMRGVVDHVPREGLFDLLEKVLSDVASASNPAIQKRLFILDDQCLIEKNLVTQEITEHRQVEQAVIALAYEM